MKISEILVNSLKYPIDNEEDITNPIILFGIPVVGVVIFVIFMGIAGLFGAGDAASGVLAIGMIVMYLFYLVFYLLYPGYMLSVIDEGINQSNIIPAMNIGKNIVNTIKLAILGFIYFIIPIILGIIVLLVSGTLGSVLSSFAANPSPLSLISSLGIGGLIVLAIFALFELLYTVAVLRLAAFDSLGAALSVGEVWADLKDIGIVKIVLLYAAVITITGFAAIGSLALFLVFPLIGLFIIMLVVGPVLSLFGAYAFGLLYSDMA
ncbi:MAG: DUF4013 domain-containing protein [Methanobrevibacter sp.]|nr:DUF4013 domain-containing protein [Methanobrevibacter sp.]